MYQVRNPRFTSYWGDGVTIQNCLSLTEGDPYNYNREKVGILVNTKNNYSYDYDREKDMMGNTVTTEDKVANGTICALLGSNWQQNVGVDAYPTPTGHGGLIFADNLVEDKYFYVGTTSNATILRTFAADGWYSLCLPFSLTGEQTAQKFAEVAEFERLEGDTYVFATTDHITAGKAYIVRVDADLVNPTFESVTIAADVQADALGAFRGMLWPTLIYEDSKVIGSGTTVNPANPGKLRAFRAYFPETPSPAAAMYFSVSRDATTSVHSLPSAASGAHLYNLSGQRVDGVYRGIVIKDGKKITKQ